MKWYLKALKNYADFLGRASKEEFWFFKLFNLIFGLIVPLLGILITNFLYAIYAICSGSYNNLNDALWNNSDETLWIGFFFSSFIIIYFIIYWLVILIPSLTVTIRRLHDTGMSAWWILFLFIFIPGIGWILLLIITLSDGTPGSNKYGENPKDKQTLDSTPHPNQYEDNPKEKPTKTQEIKKQSKIIS